MATTPIDESITNRLEYELQFDGRDPDEPTDDERKVFEEVDPELAARAQAAKDLDTGFDPTAPAPAAAPAAPAAPAAAPGAAPAAAPPAPAAPPAAPAPAPAVDDPALAPPAPPAPAPAAAPAVDADAIDPTGYVAQEMPAYKPHAPADAEDQIKAARTELSAARAKLIDGELSNDEFDAIEQKANTKVDAMNRAIARDAAFIDNQEASLNALYADKRQAAVEVLKAAGIPTDEANLRRFDKLTGMWGDEATIKGIKDGRNLAASQYALDNAVNDMKKLYGKAPAAAPVAAPGAAPAAAPAAKTEAELRAARRPDLSKLPPTLAGAPEAAGAAVPGTEFAHLEGLDDSALETAVAAMNPEQLDRYLNK